MPDAMPPLRWTLHHPDAPAPLYYTSPGGWLIQNDPDPQAPDRPWVLLRHGRVVERCHTLRIAKAAPARPAPDMDRCEHGEPEGDCPSCAACAACDGSCGRCPYVALEGATP